MGSQKDSIQSERDKILAGELYDPMDAELVAAHDRARDLCQALNATREAQELTGTE
jgi:maltose O-acetyltransferase